MERELKDNLLRCAETFAEVRGFALPTVGRLAAGDWRFFDRVRDDEKSFTVRKYDEVIGWFSDNWPDKAIWPPAVARPDSMQAVS